MIKCNKNEYGNGRIDRINKTNIEQHVDIEINIKNIECLGKKMSLSNTQHLSNI